MMQRTHYFPRVDQPYPSPDKPPSDGGGGGDKGGGKG